MTATTKRPAIVTHFDMDAPREFRWSATYREPDCQIGWGATREDAIADLTEEDEENDCE
jgi:hypothetical protein